MIDEENPQPWYRQFWAWFVLAPLIVVVIVSSYTISLAVGGADDRVLDNYYKEGRMINVRLDQDILAAKLQLQADIRFDQELGELVVELQSVDDKPLSDSLTLELGHPAKQAFDHSIVLTRVAKNSYQAELDNVLQYRWYLRLYPNNVTDDQLWRLKGEIDFARKPTIVLSPDQ